MPTNVKQRELTRQADVLQTRARVVAPQRRRQLQRTPPPVNLKTPAKGYLCMDPRVLPPFFRPSKVPCPPGTTPYVDSAVGRAPGFNPASLLDIANDGTFSGARRAATLGHQNPDDVARAINALAGAAIEGRVSEQFAGAKIAELADVPLAAAQAAQRVRALTPDELAARRARAGGGLSDSTLQAQRDARLAEACEPPFCYIEKDGLGREVAMNYGKGRTRAEIMADKAFSRFCSDEELARISGKAGDVSWGEWLVIKARQAFGPQQTTYREPIAPPLEAPRITGGFGTPGTPGGPPIVTDPNAKKYLCMDPRVLPPFFRPQDTPCVYPQIPYPGQ